MKGSAKDEDHEDPIGSIFFGSVLSAFRWGTPKRAMLHSHVLTITGDPLFNQHGSGEAGLKGKTYIMHYNTSLPSSGWLELPVFVGERGCVEHQF